MPIAAADMARRPHTFGRPNAVIAGTEELPPKRGARLQGVAARQRGRWFQPAAHADWLTMVGLWPLVRNSPRQKAHTDPDCRDQRQGSPVAFKLGEEHVERHATLIGRRPRAR